MSFYSLSLDSFYENEDSWLKGVWFIKFLLSKVNLVNVNIFYVFFLKYGI